LHTARQQPLNLKPRQSSLYGRKTAIVISEGYIGTVTCWIGTLIRVNQSPNAPTVKYEQDCTAALP
ncbi:hypothetical protein T4B_8907, partial [Trichinella pseudospiralis]